MANRYQAIINVANQVLKTPISTDAELNTTLASGSEDAFAKLIPNLVPIFNRYIANSLGTQPSFVTGLLTTSDAMGSLIQVTENNIGGVEEYNIDTKVQPANQKSAGILNYAYRTKHRKVAWTTFSQENFREAFVNGTNFGAWINQKLEREIVLPLTRWLESGVQKEILGEFKNSQDILLSADFSPENPTVMVEAMTKLLQLLQEGSKPSCLWELSYPHNTLVTMNGHYDYTTDVYQTSFDKSKHMINAFISSDLNMAMSPKTKLAMEQALANIYHDEKLAITKRFNKIVTANQIGDGEVYLWKPGTIAIEQTLNKSATQFFANSLTTDYFNHAWFRPKFLPWGIGFKIVFKKKTK